MSKASNLFERSKCVLLKTARMLEAVTLIIVIFGGGYAIGHWVTYHLAERERNQMREDHFAELARLKDIHQQTLNILAGKIVTAADKVSEAATSVDNVVKKVEQDKSLKKQ